MLKNRLEQQARDATRAGTVFANTVTAIRSELRNMREIDPVLLRSLCETAIESQVRVDRISGEAINTVEKIALFEAQYTRTTRTSLPTEIRMPPLET